MNPRFSPLSAITGVRPTPLFLSQALWLVVLALTLSLAGVALGATLALPLISSGWIMLLFVLEIGLLWTAPAWSRSSPQNIVLFCGFAVLSGMTFTPVVISVLVGYANGASILLNALISTALLTAGSAVFASMTQDLGASIGRFLFQSLIGLIVFGLLQLFIPALRGTAIEMIISGVGIVTFSLFLSYDMQRLLQRGDVETPVLLAISLYLDIFNLLLYVLRFMTAVGGRRR